MTEPSEQREMARLEQSVSDLAAAIRQAARVMRALAPVAAELRELQSALSEFQTAALTEGPPAITPPASPPHLPVAEPQPPARPVDLAPPLARFINPMPSTSPEPSTVPATTGGTAARAQMITVVVSRVEGSLDLVRVHSALDSIPGVGGLALASYTRGRAVILLDINRPPAELALLDALQEAFPEPVTGQWVSDSEFAATIGATELSSAE